MKKDENGNNISDREFIERIFEEKQHALFQRFQNIERQLDDLAKRHSTFETRLMWLIVIGSLCVAAAGLAGGVIGVLSK